jgi:hypothetical protein
MPNRSRLRQLVIALALGASSCASTPRHVPAPAVVPLSDYFRVLQTLDVSVAGRRMPFLFDTAGGDTLLTPALAAELGCQPYGRITGFRHDGERLDLPRCGELALGIGGESLLVESGVFDLMAMLPPGAPTLGGIVSLHTLGERAFTLDMSAKTLTLESPASLETRIAGMREVEVRRSTQGGGASIDLFLRVKAARGDLGLEIDSGNAAGLILSPHAVSQLGLAPPADAGGTVAVDLDIAGYGMYRTQGAVKDTIYDGVLDACFLRAHQLTVDLKSGRAWLRAADPDPGS